MFRHLIMRCGLWVLLGLSLNLNLSGCASLTPAERSLQMQQEVDTMIQVYGPACEKLGYKADTDPWRECILKLDSSHRAERLERMERLSTQMTTTDCWGYRGFFHCSTF